MTRPWWRMRYSRTAYSLGVRSMTCPPPHLAAPAVEGQVRHPEHGRGDRLGAPPQRLHTSEQLLQGEGLRDVVVGAHFERLHLEIHGVLGGEHEHRHCFAAIAQRAQHLETR